MKKMGKLRSELGRFMGKIEETYSAYKSVMTYYFVNGFNNETKSMAERVHEKESEADEIRREIIAELVRSDFLASTIEEFMHIVELSDKIADAAEKSVDNILCKSIDSSKINIAVLEEIVIITETQLGILKRALDSLFTDYDIAVSGAVELEVLEHKVDLLQRKQMWELLEHDMPLCDKMYFRDFIERMAVVSDIIEDVGDEIEKIAVKRRL